MIHDRSQMTPSAAVQSDYSSAQHPGKTDNLFLYFLLFALLHAILGPQSS
jgi:hypothetical protein